MTSGSFDFAPLLRPGLPPAAARWTGLPSYSFIGGNNDAEQVPVEGLIAAITTVLRREGSTLANYGLESGPLGYRALREFLVAKLRRDAERGDIAAVDRDFRCIDNVKYRIAIDEWLIRWNSLQYPGFYPIRTDPVSRAAIAQATHPTPSPYPRQYAPTPGRMAAVPTIPITIVNAEPEKAGGPSVTNDQWCRSTAVFPARSLYPASSTTSYVELGARVGC